MKKQTSILFLLRILKMFIGVVNLSLTAKYFGVSLGKDLWVLSLSIALFLDSIIWGPINETFRTRFVFLREKSGEKEALNKTKSLLFFTVLISIFIVIMVIVFPNFLVTLIAPSFKGMEINKLIEMVRFIAPVLLVNQLIAIGTSLLNSYNSFFIPEISGFITGIINLILIVFLAPILGIYSLLVAYYFGVLILLLMIVYQIKKLKISIFEDYSTINFRDFYIFLIFALPFFFPYFFGQISSFLEKTLVTSLGVGKLSVLDYSRKFADILTSVLTSVLLTVLAPVLSENFVNKKKDEFLNNFKQILQLGLLFISFVISIFSSCSTSLVTIFYKKGTISNDVLEEISNLMVYYSWSTFSVFIYLIFGVALLSSGFSKKYAFWGIMGQLICITLNVLFVKYIGISIFPFSFFISHLLVGIAMFFIFPFKTNEIAFLILKYIIVLILTSGTFMLTNKYLFNLENPYFNLILYSFLITGMIITMIYILNLEEKTILRRNLITIKNICRNF